MLTGIGLRNFKAFGDEMQEAPLSKITLIYGPNSGGKSSIIQTILMLKQSALEAGDAATVWGLVTRGEYVDLGSFIALLHNHDVDEKELEINISFGRHDLELSTGMVFHAVTDVDEKGVEYFDDSGALNSLTYRITNQGNVLAEAKLDGGGLWWNALVSAKGYSESHDIFLDFGTARDFLPELNLLELELLIERNQKELPERERGLVRERARLRRLKQDRQLKRQQELEEMSVEERVKQLPPDGNLEGVHAATLALTRQPEPDLLQALEQNLNLDQMMALKGTPALLKEQMSAVRYLGPLRSYPERLYRVPGVNSYFSGLRGEFTHHRLYYQPGLIHIVNDWFEQFQIPYTLEVTKVGDMAVSGEHIALVLVDNNSKTK